MSPAERGYRECSRCGQMRAGEIPPKGTASRPGPPFLCDDCKKLTARQAKKAPAARGSRTRRTKR